MASASRGRFERAWFAPGSLARKQSSVCSCWTRVGSSSETANEDYKKEFAQSRE